MFSFALGLCIVLRSGPRIRAWSNDWVMRSWPSHLVESGFLIGQLYTALLPDAVRKALGAFYTPPPLVNRLLELVALTGFDWTRGRIIDPACGGAAFLASVAPLLVESSRHRQPAATLHDIETRLLGIEVDPFAARMSMVLMDLALYDLTAAAGRPLRI